MAAKHSSNVVMESVDALVAEVNRRFGILDAGIPYYKTGGIVFPPSNGISTNIPVNQKNIVYFSNGFPIIRTLKVVINILFI